MDCIARCFPEAIDYAQNAHRPASLGEIRFVENKHIRFTGAQPIDFSLDTANKSLLFATEYSRPSLTRYSSNRFRRIYVDSGDELAGKVATVDTDLALALITNGKEPQVVVLHADTVRLERVLVRQREAQNFLFWNIGAFYMLFSSLQPG